MIHDFYFTKSTRTTFVKLFTFLFLGVKMPVETYKLVYTHVKFDDRELNPERVCNIRQTILYSRMNYLPGRIDRTTVKIKYCRFIINKYFSVSILVKYHIDK
jgi:hypothetical protein